MAWISQGRMREGVCISQDRVSKDALSISQGRMCKDVHVWD